MKAAISYEMSAVFSDR